MTHVVLMAGGRGQRLHPLTEKTPKPMVYVGMKPMLQQIVEQFRDQHFTRFTFCLGYLAEVIRSHFGDGAKFGVAIDYVVEDHPLGTAGALGLIPRPDRPFIVQNADIMAQVDYAGLVVDHNEQKRPATLCAALHQYQVPYGVITEGDRTLGGIMEKPIVSWPVAAGIYVLDPSVVDAVTGPVDMPDLLAGLDGVNVHVLNGLWHDVGSWQNLQRVNGW